MSSANSTSKARVAAKRVPPNKVVRGGDVDSHAPSPRTSAGKKAIAAAAKQAKRPRVSAASKRTFEAISDPRNAHHFTAEAALSAFGRLVS